MRTQSPPFSVQVELVEGCNLRCPFCGLQGIRAEGPNKNFKYMDPSTLHYLMTQIVDLRWNPRIEFAMHGEPTMHPNYCDMIRKAHEAAPNLQLMMTSNGGGLLRGDPVDNIVGLFQAGLRILALDEYDGINIVSKIRARTADIAGKGYSVFEYPKEPGGNPHRRVKDQFVTLMQDPSKADNGTHALIVNHCGAAFPKNDKQVGKRCHRPFRELSVRWDGNVAICCNDWRGEYKCGNTNTDGVAAIWDGLRMDAARRKLYRGERDFGPCAGCDARSYRVGLLPDPMGHDEMPPPDAETARVIEYALEGPSYTPKVPRPWET